MHKYVHTNMHVSVYANVHTCLCVRTYMRVCISICVYLHFIFISHVAPNPHSQNWNTAHNDSGNQTYYVQTEAVEVQLLNDEMVRKMTTDERA